MVDHSHAPIHDMAFFHYDLGISLSTGSRILLHLLSIPLVMVSEQASGLLHFLLHHLQRSPFMFGLDAEPKGWCCAVGVCGGWSWDLFQSLR